MNFSGTGAQHVTSGGSAFYTLTDTNNSDAGLIFDDTLVTTTLNAVRNSDGSGAKKLSFATASAGAANTITTFNVHGSSGYQVELAPSNSIWYLNTPTTSVQYVKVTGSQEAAGKTITATHSTNGGSNTNWNITP